MNETKQNNVIELYRRERKYEEQKFGSYDRNEVLSVASLLLFIRYYVDRALESYVKDWTTEIPEWLISTFESETQLTAPVKTYEDIIKIMALAGAALESYTVVNPEKWREKIVTTYEDRCDLDI